MDRFATEKLAGLLRRATEVELVALLDTTRVRALPDEELVALMRRPDEPRARVKSATRVHVTVETPKPKAKRTRKPKATQLELSPGEPLKPADEPADDESKADDPARSAEGVNARLVEELAGGHTTMRALLKQTGWRKSVVERGLKRLVAAGKLTSTGKRGMGGGYALAAANGAALA